MKITNQNDAEIIERLERVEEKIDNALKRIDSLNEKLSKHIDFIDKTYEEFAKSKYYTGFTKFGKHILDVNAIDPENFIDFVITTSVKLDKWCSDAVYETYIRELNKKETAERAVERGILLMQQWARENDRPYNVFFREISRPRAIHWIKSGRISPWVIFNSVSGVELINSFNDHELNLINEYLEPTFWTRKFEVRKDDVLFVKEILTKAGI